MKYLFLITLASKHMPENKHLVRSVLLNPRQQVLGYKLGWQKCDEDVERTTNQDLNQLLACVAAHVSHTESVLLFLDADPQAAFADALQVLSPQNTVLVLNLEDFRIAENIDLAILLHKRGFGLALRNVNLASLQLNKTLLRLIKHVEIDATHPDLVAICALASCRSRAAASRQYSTRMNSRGSSAAWCRS